MSYKGLTSHPVLTESAVAQVDIPIHTLVKVDGTICGEGEVPLGLANATVRKGEQLGCVSMGTYIAIAGEDLSINIPVMANADGHVVAVPPVSVTVPEGATPVTSSAAQPACTVAGAKLPVHVVGITRCASQKGETILIKLA